jgi:hypothetical protein
MLRSSGTHWISLSIFDLKEKVFDCFLAHPGSGSGSGSERLPMIPSQIRTGLYLIPFPIIVVICKPGNDELDPVSESTSTCICMAILRSCEWRV